MFASLPQAVNFFSTPSDQYFIVVTFLYFSMFQAVQIVQYTIRQKNIHHSSSMLDLMGATTEKKSRFCSACIQNAVLFFTNGITFMFKILKNSLKPVLKSPGVTHTYH